MLPLEIPPGTTVESLVTKLVPELHARLVGEGGPGDELSIALRIDGTASWTLRICGARMSVEEGEAERVTLWLYATKRDVARFLEDALGLGLLAARSVRPGDVATMTDPRVLKRLALASGRMELGVRDASGERLGAVLGFGAAARRPIDPENPDAVVEASLTTVQRVLSGETRPEEALADGSVSVRGNRFLPMQLALALAPFWSAKP